MTERRGTEESGAFFSKDGIYRYTLWRVWDKSKDMVMFVGLNPSTADETTDDPTIRRCLGFAKAWGYGALVMTNLFAYRSTSPRALREVLDPVGPDNDDALTISSLFADLVVAAWGTHGTYRDRDITAKINSPFLWCLGLTKGGHPKHPLYLPSSAALVPYDRACA